LNREYYNCHQIGKLSTINIIQWSIYWQHGWICHKLYTCRLKIRIWIRFMLWFMVFNATFNTISAISWRSVFIGWGNRSTLRKPPKLNRVNFYDIYYIITGSFSRYLTRGIWLPTLKHQSKIKWIPWRRSYLINISTPFSLYVVHWLWMEILFHAQLFVVHLTIMINEICIF
jgi:hypothetical protein